jgi:hypothetical protein
MIEMSCPVSEIRTRHGQVTDPDRTNAHVRKIMLEAQFPGHCWSARQIVRTNKVAPFNIPARKQAPQRQDLKDRRLSDQK